MAVSSVTHNKYLGTPSSGSDANINGGHAQRLRLADRVWRAHLWLIGPYLRGHGGLFTLMNVAPPEQCQFGRELQSLPHPVGVCMELALAQDSLCGAFVVPSPSRGRENSRIGTGISRRP